MLPDIVVSALSFWPHELELEFAFVVFALVVERVQDTVVRVLGFRRVNAQPLARWIQVFRSCLTDQQLPPRLRCCRRGRFFATLGAVVVPPFGAIAALDFTQRARALTRRVTAAVVFRT